MTSIARTGLRLVTWSLALAVVALPVVAVLNGWIGAERWPLRTLRINADLQQVDQALVRETVVPFARHGFFAVPLEQVRATVERLPWVERVEVRKRWPDILEVTVHEHIPFARWNDDKLLSVQGRLFPIEGIEVPADLPLLGGPESRTSDVVALYEDAKAIFIHADSPLRSLHLDDRGSWSLYIGEDTHVVVGSHEATLRLRRFARMLPLLLRDARQPLETADLRYTNGFALVWGEQRRNEPTVPAQGAGATTQSGMQATASVRSTHRQGGTRT